MSDLYVGAISDVELTRKCGLIQKLEGKQNILVMADHEFTIRDQLSTINVVLNIRPFMEGREHLLSEEIQRGRKIALLRVNVERVIGRIKNYLILKGTPPLTLSSIAHQRVSVCGFPLTSVLSFLFFGTFH